MIAILDLIEQLRIGLLIDDLEVRQTDEFRFPFDRIFIDEVSDDAVDRRNRRLRYQFASDFLAVHPFLQRIGFMEFPQQLDQPVFQKRQVFL